jgi:hypothetical protein
MIAIASYRSMGERRGDDLRERRKVADELRQAD